MVIQAEFSWGLVSRYSFVTYIWYVTYYYILLLYLICYILFHIIDISDMLYIIIYYWYIWYVIYYWLQITILGAEYTAGSGQLHSCSDQCSCKREILVLKIKAYRTRIKLTFYFWTVIRTKPLTQLEFDFDTENRARVKTMQWSKGFRYCQAQPQPQQQLSWDEIALLTELRRTHWRTKAGPRPNGGWPLCPQSPLIPFLLHRMQKYSQYI